MAAGPKYSDEEVRAIIDRALSRDVEGLSHADLLSVGEQVGVSAAVMSKAAEEVRAAKLEQRATTAIAARWRRWLVAHAGVFAVINGLLFAVNAATTPGQWWVLFPIVLWGLALLLHTALTFGRAPSPRAIERERVKLEPAVSAPRVRVEQAASDEEEQPAAASTALGAEKMRR